MPVGRTDSPLYKLPPQVVGVIGEGKGQSSPSCPGELITLLLSATSVFINPDGGRDLPQVHRESF